MEIDKNIKILIVDDNRAVSGIAKRLLKKLDFHDVDEATDGKSALLKVAVKTYDLIISDWNMRPMNGIDFLKMLRADGNDVPFIMVTAESKTENVLAAHEAGVDTYIVKPFSADTLYARMQDAMISSSGVA